MCQVLGVIIRQIWADSINTLVSQISCSLTILGSYVNQHTIGIDMLKGYLLHEIVGGPHKTMCFHVVVLGSRAKTANKIWIAFRVLHHHGELLLYDRRELEVHLRANDDTSITFCIEQNPIVADPRLRLRQWRCLHLNGSFHTYFSLPFG